MAEKKSSSYKDDVAVLKDEEMDIPVEGPKSEEKALNHTTPEAAKAAGVVLEGAADQWHCIAKAYNEAEGWMKTTKAMQIGSTGCLVQVTTQQKNKDGSWAVAEALCFAERVTLSVTDGVAKFI